MLLSSTPRFIRNRQILVLYPSLLPADRGEFECFEQARIISSIRLDVHYSSITQEFFDADVVIVYTRFMEHGSHSHNHGRWSGQVINCLLDIMEMPRQHLTVDKAGFSTPAAA
jgi:hypothetical protein